MGTYQPKLKTNKIYRLVEVPTGSASRSELSQCFFIIVLTFLHLLFIWTLRRHHPHLFQYLKQLPPSPKQYLHFHFLFPKSDKCWRTVTCDQDWLWTGGILKYWSTRRNKCTGQSVHKNKTHESSEESTRKGLHICLAISWKEDRMKCR